MIRQYTIIVFSMLVVSTGCSKFLDVDAPNDRLETASVFADSISAARSLTAIYSDLIASNVGLLGQKSLITGLAADEFYYSASEDEPLNFEDNNPQINNRILNFIWTDLYTQIYRANAAYEGVDASPDIIPSAKNSLKAEALFIRAFCYFYLVNYWGDVPLVTTTDYEINTTKSRTPVSEVYQQIITDLKTAQAGLPKAYPTADRGRPNKWTATALLSRVYLYTKDYTAAAATATTIIDQSGTYNLTDLDQVYKIASSETIWQIIPVNGYNNNYDAAVFIPAVDQIPGYVIRDSLMHSFETNDQRKSSWINASVINGTTYNYPYKYKVPNATDITECEIVFRLAEIYLIRAEAYIGSGNFDMAKDDINAVRSRAGLGNITIANAEEGQTIIERERIHELFSEWGHRWLDLKRWPGRADAVLSILKGANWQSTDVLWPIPAQQILLNQNLTQNNGYF